MDLEVSLLFERAENELLAAEVLKKLSEEAEAKQVLEVPAATTFYSSVINHAYYAIFYSAKAYLTFKGFKLPEQGQHQAVYYEFKRFVQKGDLKKELLDLYDEVKTKAETLLSIIQEERGKREEYTYKTLPQANKEPAENSLKNARLFVSHMRRFSEKI